ncbi:MAG: hypothetical protein IKD47_01380 [Clostridia bacterium]|nr:hypothetical protein [Clostridia bacterium]
MVEKIKKNLPLLALVFGIFAVLMVFCPWVGREDYPSYCINGWDIVFGNEDVSLGYGYLELSFSVLGFLTLACIIGGVVCTILADIMADKKSLFTLIAGICFAVAALGLLLSIASMSFNTEILKKNGATSSEIREYIADYKDEADFVLGAGALIGALCCAISACCTLIPALMEKAAPVAAETPAAEAPVAAPAAEAAPAEVAQASEPTDAE